MLWLKQVVVVEKHCSSYLLNSNNVNSYMVYSIEYHIHISCIKSKIHAHSMPIIYDIGLCI